MVFAYSWSSFERINFWFQYCLCFGVLVFVHIPNKPVDFFGLFFFGDIYKEGSGSRGMTYWVIVINHFPFLEDHHRDSLIELWSTGGEESLKLGLAWSTSECTYMLEM